MSETKPPSRPRDANQLAKLIADIATGDGKEAVRTEDGKNLAAVLLGRRGGLRGGAERARRMTPERRSEIARVAATARWSRPDHEKE